MQLNAATGNPSAEHSKLAVPLLSLREQGATWQQDFTKQIKGICTCATLIYEHPVSTVHTGKWGFWMHRIRKSGWTDTIYEIL